MRARGAKVTDIVVLVVAADDGVMPQTVEAIHHAKAAKVPIIVAINKIDKPEATPDRVRTELLQHEIQVEDLGGEVQDVEVSATKNTNLDKLRRCHPPAGRTARPQGQSGPPAEGAVIEAKLDQGRGPVATVLVQRGTLKVGDIVVAGAEWGRVRALVNDTRRSRWKSPGRRLPVEVLGFSGAPEAGDDSSWSIPKAARAKSPITARGKRREDAAHMTGMRGSLEQMMSQLKTAGEKEFPLVSRPTCRARSKRSSARWTSSAPTRSGAQCCIPASAASPNATSSWRRHRACRSSASMCAPTSRRATRAERDGVEIRYYNIIYNLVDDVKAAMSGMLTPTIREKFLGNAAILEVFNISKVGKVAGCRVTEGVVRRGAKVRLIRDNVVIHEGKLSHAQALQG